MHQASNLLRFEDRLFFSLHFHIVKCGDQNETEWEQTTTIPVVPLENPFSYLPLTTGRLSHQSDNPQIER
ncbi:hypothetical protein RchiOBHm_Chr5g0054451 [Rosa chinensis]|uniref:Uncharacterized protein n=1 Tax=Rosa chinensis TaxID=74649 RepID=A0A2P6QG56_ROSCH|nr:hypothetical protein RchiOBHm_Chr5g0054451 [Rosa chinensis]